MYIYFLSFSWWKILTFFQLFSHCLEYVFWKAFSQSSLQTFCSWKNSRFFYQKKSFGYKYIFTPFCGGKYSRFLNTLLPVFSWIARDWKNSRFPDYFSPCLFFLVGKTHVFSNTFFVKTHVFSTIFSIYKLDWTFRVRKLTVFSLFLFMHITNFPKTFIFGIIKKNWQCVSKMSE